MYSKYGHEIFCPSAALLPSEEDAVDDVCEILLCHDESQQEDRVDTQQMQGGQCHEFQMAAVLSIETEEECEQQGGLEGEADVNAQCL